MEDLSFTLRHNPLAGKITLRVRDDGQITVTAPPGTPHRIAERFVMQNADWLRRQKEQINYARKELTQVRQEIFWQGKPLPLRIAVGAQHKGRVEIENKRLIVYCSSEDNRIVRPLIEKWFIDQAKKYFPARVLLLADVLGVNVASVTIRSQRTRWGSCSSRRTISLNWRLMMPPVSVSDYVIYHELCHLIHPNHSSSFWQTVADVCPQYRQAKQWLTDRHRLLHF